MTIVLSVLIGFCLDCLFGDPANLWHPICAIGKLISKTEALLRRVFPSTPNALLIAGILLWFIVCGSQLPYSTHRVIFAVPHSSCTCVYCKHLFLLSDLCPQVPC